MTDVSNTTELQQWLLRLEALDPRKIEMGLQRAQDVWRRMGLRLSAKIVTIAGTNGKGTTAAILTHLLSTQGQRVGTYTSPHLLHFRERISLLSRYATDGELVEAFEAVDSAREATPLTYFEFTTLACGYLFAHAGLDVWVLEVGLGGRLDAVNIFDADVAVVTNIGLDHLDWLGSDRESIAREKAGVFRAGKPAIFASLDRPKNIDTVAATLSAKPVFVGREFGIRDNVFWWTGEEGQMLEMPIAVPEHAVKNENLAGALAAFCYLSECDVSGVIDSDVLSAIAPPGRFQTERIGTTKVIFDVAHNEDSAHMLAKRLLAEGLSDCTAVLGVMADKDIAAIVQPLLPIMSRWVLVTPNSPRAAECSEMESVLHQLGVRSVDIVRSEEPGFVERVIHQVNTAVVFGSFYTVADIMRELRVDIE